MDGRGALNYFGLLLGVGAVGVCTSLHVATFFTILPPMWILPAFILSAGSIACSNAVQSRKLFVVPSRKSQILACVMVCYAAFTFIYFYKVTEGASGVAIIDGEYVYQYKSKAIRAITKDEYRMFPNLWTRVMTAWFGMIAASCIDTLRISSNGRHD